MILEISLFSFSRLNSELNRNTSYVSTYLCMIVYIFYLFFLLLFCITDQDMNSSPSASVSEDSDSEESSKEHLESASESVSPSILECSPRAFGFKNQKLVLSTSIFYYFSSSLCWRLIFTLYA